MTSRRSCARLAAKRIRSQLDSDDETSSYRDKSKVKPSATASPAKYATSRESDASRSSQDAPRASARPPKRLKPNAASTIKPKDLADLRRRLFDGDGPYETEAQSCRLPLRQHSLLYHRPLLLQGPTGKQGRAALLDWFDSVSTRRRMPWRKDWIDPKDYDDAAELRHALSVRAYEVWISEIMLQQTRVSVVIDYWERWMAKWPTIEQLAVAEEDEVVSAWRGLGYYSRAKRIHEAAKIVVRDPSWRGLLPHDAGELQAKIPGVGRYTAGAISSIVFGKATSMVQVASPYPSHHAPDDYIANGTHVNRDGNVLRVLSRQLGILGDVKSDKVVIDLLWAAANALVEAVVLDSPDPDDTGNPRPSDRPGRWGQALMELGSTICTPNPDCAACPITVTCHAHQEGRILAAMQGHCQELTSETSEPVDIEDACDICEPLEDVAEYIAELVTPKASAPRPKQATLSSYFSPQTSNGAGKKGEKSLDPDPQQVVKIAAGHARRFPLKVAKKALREQETVVCAVRRSSDGRYLLQKRPEKGKTRLGALAEAP